MWKTITVDLKLLATGIGLGGLVCAFATGNPVCAMVGAVGAAAGLCLRIVEGRI